MREFSIPALTEIPANANLAGVIFRRAAEQPQAVVLRLQDASGAWQDVTAGRLRDEVVAAAKGLVAAGIEAGDRVALMSHSRYEWTLLDYAIWAAGAVTVPVYETSSAEQAEWILSNSGARACFVETAAFGQVIDGFRTGCPRWRRCGRSTRLPMRRPRWTRWTRWWARVRRSATGSSPSGRR